MSDGATTGIDPRFDPRYQRGYAGQSTTDGAAGNAADAAAPPVPTAARVPEPPEPVRSLIAPPRDRASDPAVAVAIATRASDIEDDPEVFSAWIAEAEPAEAGADVPFLAAWAVSATAVVIGTVLVWAGVSSTKYFGPSNEADRLLQAVSWNVAPSLIEIGLLGVVVMLVWSGIKHARAQVALRPARDATAAVGPGVPTESA